MSNTATATKPKPTKSKSEKVKTPKFEYVVGTIVRVAMHFCIWLHNTNHSRSVDRIDPKQGTGKELVNSFFLKGFMDGAQEIVEGTPLAGGLHTGAPFENAIKLVAEHMAVLKQFLDKLYETDGEKSTDESRTALKVFRAIHCGEGDVLKPIPMDRAIWMTTGHQRSDASFWACVKRETGGKTVSDDLTLTTGIVDSGVPTGYEDLMLVPVMIRKYRDEDEREERQTYENVGKKTGVTPTSPRDRLAQVRRWYEAGKNQHYCRTMYGQTEGIRLFGVVTLNARFPKLDFYKRTVMLIKDPKNIDPLYIPYAKIKSAEIPKLVLRTNPTELAKHNATQTKIAADRGGKVFVEILPQTEEDVADKIKEWVDGTGPKINLLASPEHEALRDQNPNPIIQAVATAHLTGTTNGLKMYTDLAVSCQALVGIVGTFGYKTGDDDITAIGEYGSLETLLVKLAEAGEAGMVEKASKAVKEKFSKAIAAAVAELE